MRKNYDFSKAEGNPYAKLLEKQVAQVNLMSFHRYDRDSDVHIIDCGGKVSLETGLARLRVLERELAARQPRDGVAKLLIDFRNTVWEDESVHMELSRITRTEFGLNPGNSSIRAAIVNTRWSGQISDNERWFLSDAAAMQWLCSSGVEELASSGERNRQSRDVP